MFRPEEFEFPVDFNPFDFDYDFKKYDFEDTDFETASFLFDAFMVGDINGTAILEDGLIANQEASTRNVDGTEQSSVADESAEGSMERDQHSLGEVSEG